MWELAGQLVPEMVGLAVTPAAVIACLLLLGSSHPFRNVAALAAPFLVVYGLLGAAALAVGRTAGVDTDDPSTARGWLGVVVGVVFLSAGVTSWVRPALAASASSQQASQQASQPARLPAPAVSPPPSTPARSPSTAVDAAAPRWATRLRDPSVRLVLGVGFLLAVVNPNVAILASGFGVILTADAGLGVQVGGVALLLSASMLDFVVPTLVFVLAGVGGRRWLRTATGWLLDHNHVIGIAVLVAFGILFVVRGMEQVAG